MCELPSIIKNIFENFHLDLSNLHIFNRVGSPVDKRKFNSTNNVAIGEVKQNITNVIIALPEQIPQLSEKNSQSIEQLKKVLLPQLSSNDFVVSEEDKKQINNRIDEAVALMNLNRLDDAKTSLLTILGEIKNSSQHKKEQVRVYNNIGVIYNRPKPDGDYDEAIKYFNEALNIDPNFSKAKMNLASVYMSKSDDESIKKGYDSIRVLWESEKTPEVLQLLLWAIYKQEKSAKKVIEFIDKEKTNLTLLISKKGSLLDLIASFYLESGDTDEAIVYNDKALAQEPEEPAFITTKAKSLMLKAQQNYIIPSEFDIIPKLSEYKDVKEAEILFTKALELSEKQKIDYLISEIRYGLSTCKLWLGKYNEAKQSLQMIKYQTLPDLLAHKVNILNFATHIHERDFEVAYNLLVNSDNYPKIDYQEKFRIARIFLYNGAPEQAKLLYDSLEVEAERYKDINYWQDLSAVFVLLNKQQEAISAATKVKILSEEKDGDIKKNALSLYNAVMYHYTKSVDSQDSETGRLVEGMFDMQKKFPEDKIITPVKVIDEDGNPTQEIKDMLTQMKNRYEKVRDIFKTNPIPTYYIEQTFHRTYSDLMARRDDPEFTIQFTDVSDNFQMELKDNFKNAQGYVFDYLSLLDLAKMGFLGFLDKLGKPVFIHKLLFQKIQEELLQNEIEELRELWNFLRRSKAIKFIDQELAVELKSSKIDDIFDSWLVETIKYAKINSLSICTDDLRFYSFLKSENIKPINITILLKDWLGNKIIDGRMYSRSIGDLAERFFVFLSYKGEDLFEIVLEDGGKITPRSYHLVREVLLQGSILESFMPVFAKFIDLFWQTGSLPQEKVNWIKFLTNIIIEIIDKDFVSLRNSKMSSEAEAAKITTEIIQKLTPAINSLKFIWSTATNKGSKDDLRELLKVADEVLNREYLIKSKQILKQRINEKLAK